MCHLKHAIAVFALECSLESVWTSRHYTSINTQLHLAVKLSAPLCRPPLWAELPPAASFPSARRQRPLARPRLTCCTVPGAVPGATPCTPPAHPAETSQDRVPVLLPSGRVQPLTCMWPWYILPAVLRVPLRPAGWVQAGRGHRAALLCARLKERKKKKKKPNPGRAIFVKDSVRPGSSRIALGNPTRRAASLPPSSPPVSSPSLPLHCGAASCTGAVPRGVLGGGGPGRGGGGCGAAGRGAPRGGAGPPAAGPGLGPPPLLPRPAPASAALPPLLLSPSLPPPLPPSGRRGSARFPGPRGARWAERCRAGRCAGPGELRPRWGLRASAAARYIKNSDNA